MNARWGVNCNLDKSRSVPYVSVGHEYNAVLLTETLHVITHTRLSTRPRSFRIRSYRRTRAREHPRIPFARSACIIQYKNTRASVGAREHPRR